MYRAPEFQQGLSVSCLSGQTETESVSVCPFVFLSTGARLVHRRESRTRIRLAPKPWWAKRAATPKPEMATESQCGQAMAMAFDESKLLPFQREGVASGTAFGGRILLGDEMGLGKTVQAIALACQFHTEWPLLIIAPTSMCLPWCEELERWCPFLRPGDINLVRSHHNGALRLAPVTIVSYGLLTNGKEKERLAAGLAAAGFGIAIADEAHYLKSKDAMRSQMVLPLLAAARRCILLTGTPALNRPVELFTLLNVLCPRVPQFATYKAFTERYCDAQVRFVGRGARRLDVSGCSHAQELHDLMTRHGKWLAIGLGAQAMPLADTHVPCSISGERSNGASSEERGALRAAAEAPAAHPAHAGQRQRQGREQRRHGRACVARQGHERHAGER